VAANTSSCVANAAHGRRFTLDHHARRIFKRSLGIEPTLDPGNQTRFPLRLRMHNRLAAIHVLLVCKA
jgi:hypothetical protein